MGSLDTNSGVLVKRQIKVVDITGSTPAQIEAAFNNNWGLKGWRVVQVVTISNKTYLVAEREY